VLYSPSSGERTGNSPNLEAPVSRGCGTADGGSRGR